MSAYEEIRRQLSPLQEDHSTYFPLTVREFNRLVSSQELGQESETERVKVQDERDLELFNRALGLARIDHIQPPTRFPALAVVTFESPENTVRWLKF